MASDWQKVTLDQLGRIVTGKTPSSSRPEHFGGEIPFITPTDFDGRRFIDSTARYLSAAGAESLSGLRIPRGSVMVSCIGSDMGKAALAARESVTNQQINSIIVDPTNSFLFIYYNLSKRKAEIRNSASGSAQPILNKTAFGQLEVLLPPLPEQDAIGRLLGTLDDRIELNRQMNETLESMARALFNSWFVNFDPVLAKAEGRDPRLPKHFADLFPNSFEASEVGEIPRGWRVGHFGDVADNPRRGASPDEIQPTTPYIALEHMPRKCIAIPDWGTAAGVESGKFVFHVGEILFGQLRPYFHKVGVAPVDGVCSTDILVVIPKSEDWFGFVLGHVSSEAFVEYTNAGSTGTKMPRTNWSDMARYAVVLPPEPLAAAFASSIYFAHSEGDPSESHLGNASEYSAAQAGFG